MPTHPARARKLLSMGRAVVVSAVPFVIRLKDKTVSDGTAAVQDMGLGIDPGSKHTGLAVYTTSETLDRGTGELASARVGVFGVQVDHRGHQIKEKLAHRSQMRRGRRSRKTRYRAPRFNNRTRPAGWLAPSLQHRVDTALGWVNRLSRWFPITSITQELVRFDLHKLQNPEVSGAEYQRGTLFGFEVREYLLAKYERRCVYCGVQDVPLNLDHVVPRARGGSDRVSNLVLSCIGCNQAKSARPVEEFLAKDPKRLAKVLSGLKRPLRDASAVNSTRWALYRALVGTGIPVSTGSGGMTKFNRTRSGVGKSHVLDALCVGAGARVAGFPALVLVARSMGRGVYQRIMPNKYGFARGHRSRVKQHYGFITGDLVRAVKPAGKYAGTYVDRIQVRATGKFKLMHGPDVSHKHCVLVQRGDGWGFDTDFSPVG